MNFKTVLVASACAALVVGCGSDGGGAGDLGDDFIRGECEYLFRCAGDEDTAYDRVYYGTERACVDSELGSYSFEEELRPYLDAGTVVYDAAAARRCLAALRATCAQTLAREQACDSIFTGQVADGGGCSDDVECVSGLCSGNAVQCGSCQALVPTGSPCDFFDVCAPGPNGERGYCGGVCAFRENTYATVDAALGTPCDDYQDLCEPGLFCQDGICARWRALDEACDPYADSCAPGTFCLPTPADEDVGTCVAVRVESGPGEDCGVFLTEVVVCDPQADLYCTDEEGQGVCALYQPTTTQGDYCDVTAECIAGLECRGGYCIGEPVADGMTCVVDAECQSGNCLQELNPPFARTCQAALSCP